MSIYVYRTRPSTGARQLAEALDGKRIRQKENMERLARPGDTVVCWGEAFTKPGVTVLNGGAFRSKLSDIEVLTAAGVRTVQALRNRPTISEAAREDPVSAAYSAFLQTVNDWPTDTPPNLLRGPVTAESIRALRDALGHFERATMIAPPVPVTTPDPLWVGRSNNHVGGLDLLTPPATPDYYVKRENITEEYRLHVFDGKSIRAGKKAPRTGVPNPSNWIRSFDGGWKIVYDRYESTTAQRNLAASAVRALGLTFGAVDLGLLADGNLITLEVNRAPGLEGGTIEAYARAIERWEEAQERIAA